MFEMEDCPANREAVFRQSRASMKDWKHDLKNHWKQMQAELGTTEGRRAKPESIRTLQDWQRYLSHISSSRFEVILIFIQFFIFTLV